MRAKVRKLTCLIVALIVAVFTVGYAFAWFVDRKDAIFSISGASAGAYFDSTSGDGTSEEEAFVIANSTHMRNLAVLQNTGRFRGDKYYFKIKDSVDEIDMGSLWLPPIGNDDNPFIGEFNGNGKTISNLKVTTDKSLLTEANYPTQAAPAYKFSQAVGLFGNTGEGSNIRNFILDKPHVLVGAESTTAYGTATEKVVGIAVGHVAGMCQSIGVRATDAGAGTADGEGSTSLDVRVTGYSTFNSILGELGEGVESSVTGGGHTAGTGGSGAAFGANFDIGGLVDRLVKIHDNESASWRLPMLGDYYLNTSNAGTYGTTLAGMEKIPFTVGRDSTYVGADAKETDALNNIGYILGNQTKFYSKTYTFGEPMTISGDTYVHTDKVIPKWIYRRNGNYGANYSTSSITALTQNEMDSLPQNIIEELFPSEGNTMALDSIAISQTYNNVGVQIYPGSTSNGQWSPHGQISWNGKTYGEGFRGATSTASKDVADAVDENGLRYTADGYKLDENDLMFDNDGYVVDVVWPLQNVVDEEGYLLDTNDNRVKDTDGEDIKISGVGYEVYQEGNAFYLKKANGNELAVYDEWGGTHKLPAKKGTAVAYNNFTKGIPLPNNGIWFKPTMAGTIRILLFAEDTGKGITLIQGHRPSATKENPFIVDYSVSGGDMTRKEVAKCDLPAYVLCYFEYTITQEEIDDGRYEYWIVKNDSGGGAGANFVYLDLGASAAEDTSAVVPDKVSAVDFIYDGVEIEQEDETIGIGNFIVDTSGTKALYDSTKTSVYFEKITMVLKVVYVRLHNDETDGHSGKTICLEYSDPKLDTNSEVKATYATYVCPTIGGGSGTVSGGGGGGGTVTPTPDPTPDEPTVENLIGELTGTLTTGSTLCDNAYITATLGGGGATVTATSATSDDGKTFNSYLLPAGSSRTYSVAAKQKVTVIIYYTIRDSSGVKQGEVTAAVTRSDGTSEQVTSSDGTRVDSKAYKLEITLEAGDSFVLSSGNRLTLYGIYLSK